MFFPSFSLDSSIFSYVIVPSTFHPKLTGKFQVELYVKSDDMKYVQFTKTHIQLKPEDIEAEVDPLLRKINSQFEKYTQECIELVQLTETASHALEHVTRAGRNLLAYSAQLKDSLLGWVNNNEPDWFVDQKAWDQYEEQYDEYYEEQFVEKQSDAPKPPPPPPNFSKPVKVKMIETTSKSMMTEEMMNDLENRPIDSGSSDFNLQINAKLKNLKTTTKKETDKRDVVDEILQVIRSGIKNLKPVSQRVLSEKPKIENIAVCAFNIVDQIMARRHAVEGDDEDESWSDGDDEWSEDKED